MTEWQPIETAPKGEHGSPIILWARLCGHSMPFEVRVATFSSFGPTSINGELFQGWMSIDGDVGLYGNLERDELTATHWMPLPEPPERKSE